MKTLGQVLYEGTQRAYFPECEQGALERAWSKIPPEIKESYEKAAEAVRVETIERIRNQ
jgi:hypothetical protein